MHAVTANTAVEAWVRAAKHLHAQDDWRQSRLILEVSSPISMPKRDRAIFEVLNGFLVEHDGLPVVTVANTIFPQGLYRRVGAKGLREAYLAAYPSVMKHCDARRWGTYFHRMIYRVDAKGNEISPLFYLVDKLKKKLANRAIYELNPIDLFTDLPTYDAGLDKHHPVGGPCLSHVSFSLTADRALDATAIYRSHFYIQRALGNLIGLANLQRFVATEAGLEVGTLACISNTAQLEAGSGEKWSKKEITALLEKVAAVDESAIA